MLLQQQNLIFYSIQKKEKSTFFNCEQLTTSFSIIKTQMNLKIQNMKEAAYFDYFKSFSLNAFDTIKKLQTQFKDQIQQSFFFDSNMMFKRIRTLLGSYEILIFEINDSCEFVQIPQFGNCILKIFLQIMSIIRFLLHKIIATAQNKKQQCLNIQQKNNKQKASLNITHTNFACTASPLNDQQKMIYKKKQQSKYLLSNLNQQLSLLQTEQIQNIQHQKRQYKSLIEGKQKLQGIEVSQNENILSEALNNFCKKGEHLKNFVNIRQAAMVNNMKQGMGEYMKLKDILDDDSNHKLNSASVKLQELFHKHTINFIKEKQDQMINQETQANIIDESLQAKILQQNKLIKKLNQKIKLISDQLHFQKQKCKSLQELLKSKTQQFQLKTMQYRVAQIQMQKSKIKQSKLLESQLNLMNMNNASRANMCSQCQNKIASSPSMKKSQECVSKSIIDDDQSNMCQILNSNNEGQDQIKLDEILRLNHSKLMNRRVYYQSGNNKKQIVFKNLDTKSDQFQLFTKVWDIKIQPLDTATIIKKQPIKKKTTLQRTKSNNVAYMNNTYSYRDHKRSKTKNYSAQQRNFYMQIQKVINQSYIPNNKKISPMKNNNQTKLLGIINYKKKNTQSGSQENDQVYKQITQKWLENGFTKNNRDQMDGLQNMDHPQFQRNQTQVYQTANKFQNKGLTESQNQKRPRTSHQRMSNTRSKIQLGKYKLDMIRKKNSDNQQNQMGSINQRSGSFNYEEQQSQNYQSNQFSKYQQVNKMSPISQLFKKYSKKQGNMLLNEQNNLKPENSLIPQQRLSQQHQNQNQLQKYDIDRYRYPRFNKFSGNNKIILSMKQLINLFFDINTAKNFQYINLFQNDQIKVSSIKGIRKTNALSVNIQQMQKKNFINNLISKVKNQVTSMNNTQSNMSIKYQASTGKYKVASNIITECSSMNATFSGTMMKTHFWNNLSPQAQKDNQNVFQINLLLKNYDFEKLIGILFKQLKDLKRMANVPGNSNGMNNYCIVRNFLRYPHSTINLANDKQFQQKQKQDSQIQYLQLRKILQRVLKLHKNCAQYTQKSSNLFERIGLNENKQLKKTTDKQNQEGYQPLCCHILQFYQSIGIMLVPSIKRLQ